MTSFFEKCRALFQDKSIIKRVFLTLLGLVIFRLLAAIPIPGVDVGRLALFFQNNQFLSLLNIFSGGGLSNLSIVMLGVGPYITASIIMQLLTMMFDSLKQMYQEEGQAGRLKFSQYTRLLTVPLAIIQAFSFILLLQKQGVVPALGLWPLITNVLIVVAGSVLLMWIGELISEFGIGNGASLIIFAGIVSHIPTVIAQNYALFDTSKIPEYGLYLLGAIAIIYLVVYVTEAERPVPVTYSRQVRGGKVMGGVSTYLPLRLNQAGVIPIIFALSILLFPQLIVNILARVITGGAFATKIKVAAQFVTDVMANQWFYGVAYFVLVVLFTYFYTAVTFEPKSISENLQKSAAFIPGVRPGASTTEFLGKIVTRITLVGALFLGFIAILPLIVRGFTGEQSLTFGGTALLIVVSVVLDLVKKIDAQATMREY